MTLEEITLEILAERAFSQFDSQKLVYWAISVLELGHESANLYILAGDYVEYSRIVFDTTVC